MTAVTQKQLDEWFLKAVRNDKLEDAQRFLDMGANINCTITGVFWHEETALSYAIQTRKPKTIAFMLERKANANIGGLCPPLHAAIKARNGDLVNTLLAYGVDIDAKAIQLASKKKNRAMLKLIDDHKAAVLKKQLEAEEAARVAKAIEEANHVTFESPLGGRILQEIFNFVTFERISILCDAKTKAAEAMTRDRFDAVDQDQLRKAFEEHVRRGGKADKDDVFPNGIFTKPKITGT